MRCSRFMLATQRSNVLAPIVLKSLVNDAEDFLKPHS